MWSRISWSGARPGMGFAAVGPRSPSQPPSPRMKSDVRSVNMAAPLPASTAFDSTSTTAAFPLSHMASRRCVVTIVPSVGIGRWRSEEHTSELQSRRELVCRLLLEKKKKTDLTKIHEEKKKKTKMTR